MAKIEWEKVWEAALKNKELFPVITVKKKTVSVSCPTRFSNNGKLSIEVTPVFNDESITLELLVFNDNLSLEDLQIAVEEDNLNLENENRFNKFANQLCQYELSNRVVERFEIKSSGFSSATEAENSLVDYINNKATESGRMFDDKLDELNDIMNNKEEKYDRLISTIRNNRSYILKKAEAILNNYYGWKSMKNEDYQDTSIQCLDNNGNLMAVVTLADKCIIVDLAKDITAKVSLMQSDEQIEAELVDDVDNAQQVLADREIDQLRDVVANNVPDELETASLEDEDYLESLSCRVSKLESLYISRKLHRIR